MGSSTFHIRRIKGEGKQLASERAVTPCWCARAGLPSMRRDENYS